MQFTTILPFLLLVISTLTFAAPLPSTLHISISSVRRLSPETDSSRFATYLHKFYQSHERSEPFPHALVDYISNLNQVASKATSSSVSKEGDGLKSKFVYHIHLTALKLKAWKPAKPVDFKLVHTAHPSQPLVQHSPSVIDTSSHADSEESNKTRMDLKKREEPKEMVKKVRDMGSLAVAVLQEWLNGVSEKVKDEPSPKKALLGDVQGGDGEFGGLWI